MLSSIFITLICLSLATPASPAPSASFALRPRQLHSFPTYDDIFSCPAASWPPASIGDLLTPQLPDHELQKILAEIDPARIKAIIASLASFGTRHTLSSQTDPVRGVGAARDWYILPAAMMVMNAEWIQRIGLQSKCALSPPRARGKWK